MKNDLSIGDFDAKDYAVGIGYADGLFAAQCPRKVVESQRWLEGVGLKLFERFSESRCEIAMLAEKPFCRSREFASPQ